MSTAQLLPDDLTLKLVQEHPWAEDLLRAFRPYGVDRGRGSVMLAMRRGLVESTPNGFKVTEAGKDLLK